MSASKRYPRICFFLMLQFAGVVAAARTDGQVVQLPTFRTFSYSGSVLVPDSGTASLGGVGRSVSRSSSSSSFGPRGRNLGGVNSLGGAGVSATIIDLEAMDRAILDQSPTIDRKDRVEEGKALVRHGRTMFRAGRYSASHASYQMAIQLLDGRLKRLAQSEYARVFPTRD